MQISKRSFPIYVLLNLLTLGIYGMIVSLQVNKEIDAICKGDGEQPHGYGVAFIFRAIAPLVGLLVGFIVAMIGVTGTTDVLDVVTGNALIGDFPSMIFALSGSIEFATVLLVCAYFCVLFTAGGTLISSIYYNYWWYKQANRLKLNANRYGLDIKESGIDTFVLRTVAEALFIPISVVCIAFACIAPLLFIWIFSYVESMAALVIISIIVFIVCVALCIFGGELTTGAQFSMFFIFKNLNRFADVYRNGAAPFDPMAYEYYPSVESKYPNFVPNMVNGVIAPASASSDVDVAVDNVEVSTGVLRTTGSLIGVNGTCAGYNFDLTSGEEIIIGKDAKVSMVVIDPAYKEISRKHVGVCYDIIRDQYRVVDYSSNGTWANGSKLVPGQEVYLPHGTELKLANDKNTFRLG